MQAMQSQLTDFYGCLILARIYKLIISRDKANETLSLLSLCLVLAADGALFDVLDRSQQPVVASGQ